MSSRAVPALLLCVLAAAPVARAEESGFTVTGREDWVAGRLGVEIARAIDQTTPALARAKSDAEEAVESRLSAFLMEAISRVLVDSSHTFGELLSSDSRLFARVQDLVLGARLEDEFLSKDFSTLVARYSLPFFGDRGFASPLYPSRENPIRRRLGYVSTRRFTGLLIWAKGRLPIAGAAGEQNLRPALFPRIFDEDLTLVMDRGMAAPETLIRWGMAGYAKDLDDSAVLRAGASPLRVAARAVFGDNSTDIVIPTEAALQLLTSPENIALLREGRIVIVCDGLE